MRVSISPRNRYRLVRALRIEARPDGMIDMTLLRLDPGQQSPVIQQTFVRDDPDFNILADGAPAFDARGAGEYPEGIWPARRTAGGWIALIDEPAPFFAPMRTASVAMA